MEIIDTFTFTVDSRTFTVEVLTGLSIEMEDGTPDPASAGVSYSLPAGVFEVEGGFSAYAEACNAYTFMSTGKR